MKNNHSSTSNFKIPKAALLCLFVILVVLLDKSIAFIIFKRDSANAKAMYMVDPSNRRNRVYEIDAFGDLGDVKFSTSREIISIFDNDGFRNDKQINNKKYMITGDSFALGGAVSENYTITNQAIELLKEPVVYNTASLHPKQVLKQYKKELPTAIFFIKVERNINPDEVFIKQNKSTTLQTFLKLSYTKSKLNPPKKPIVNEYFEAIGQRFLKSTDKDNTPTLEKTVAIIKETSDACRKKGVEFVFVAIPNKHSIYKSSKGEYHGFLKRLYAELEKEEISYIDLLTPMTIPNGSKRFFWDDDTHCNPKGYREIATQIVHYINQSKVKN